MKDYYNHINNLNYKNKDSSNDNVYHYVKTETIDMFDIETYYLHNFKNTASLVFVYLTSFLILISAIFTVLNNWGIVNIFIPFIIMVIIIIYTFKRIGERIKFMREKINSTILEKEKNNNENNK